MVGTAPHGRGRPSSGQPALRRPGGRYAADLAERADPREPVGEAVLLDQLQKAARRPRRSGRPCPVVARRPRSARHPPRRREQHRGVDLLEVPLGDHRRSYLAKMTSPCWVTLNDPLTEPGACAGAARPRPARRRGRAHPAAVDTVSRTPWAAARWPGLGVEQPQGWAIAGPSSLADFRVPRASPRVPRRWRRPAGQHPGARQCRCARPAREPGRPRSRTAAPRRPAGSGYRGARNGRARYTAADTAERVKLATHRRHASTPLSVLDPGHGADGGQHLLGLAHHGPPGSVPGSAPPPGQPPAARPRPGVHLAVLPTSPAGQSERLHLPDKVLQLTERLLGRPRRGSDSSDERRRRHDRPRVGQVGVPDPVVR